jgi:hypothetical protein
MDWWKSLFPKRGFDSRLDSGQGSSARNKFASKLRNFAVQFGVSHVKLMSTDRRSREVVS